MKYTLGLIHLSCLRSVVAWQSIPSLVCDSGRIRHSGPAWDSCETKTYFATCLPSLKKSSARFGIIDSYDYLGEVQKPNRPPLRRPIRPTSSAGLDRSDDDQHQRGKTGDAPIGLTPHEQAMQDPTLLSSTNVTQAIKSPYLLRYLRETGILQLTRVQQETYGVIRQGKSLVARSKTGSGKTLAFLLPILDDLLEKRSTRPQAECSQLPLLPRSDEAQVLILVPTRELGLQILEQIQDLLKHRPDALTVMNLSGGTTSLGTDRCFLAQLKRTPDLLVATPGRLVDLITERPGSSPTRIGRRKFCDVLGNIRTLVLDEADRILLEGFKKETIRILSVLPRTEKRQTLLFSATIPEKMNEQLESILPNNFTRVDCIEEANICDRVTRAYWKIPSMECYTASLIAVILREIELDPHRYKVLVFFPTAKLVRFYANLYKEALDNTVLEIHSRMSQSSRNKARLSFTRATKGILFTSDVTARGLDYPDVSVVVQLGAPFSANLNTHRIGRTARAGRSGKAILVLLPFETKSTENFALKFGFKDYATAYSCDRSRETISKLRLVLSRNKGLRANADEAYLSFVAYYAEYGPRFLTAKALLDAAAAFASELGMSQIPEIPEKLRLSLEKR